MHSNFLNRYLRYFSIWVNSNLLKIVFIKSALIEVSASVYWTYNRICVFDITVHNDYSLTGFESALSAEGLKQSALTIRPRATSLTETTRNLYTHDPTMLRRVRKSWVSCKSDCIFVFMYNCIDCISAAQIRWNIKRLFNSNVGISRRN